MASGLLARIIPQDMSVRANRLNQEKLASTNKFLLEALTTDKRNGLRLAVRARWVALGVIALLLPYLNFTWSVLYYEALLAGFALIGWAQLRAGRVGQSRQELALIFCDLAFMTFTLVVPNPFFHETWPTAMQYKFDGFMYFYVLLAASTMAYSWRTVFAFSTWTTGLWLGALILVVVFGTEIPALTDGVTGALVGYERMLEFLDPNDPQVQARVQEVVVFVIVAGILALNSWRTNQLILAQSDVARERANLARHFPPTIVDQLADRDQPLGAVRSQTVVVMFADIVGFTRMAEQRSPEDVVAMLREFHGHLESAVFNHHGTLDKFLGDGIMATFGTPDPSPEDAANALRCAREMMTTIDQWNGDRVARGEDPVRLSIGIHCGEVVLGDIGSERRLEFAALGDTVNVANRLEALTRDLHVRMIVSDGFVDALRAATEDQGRELLTDFHSGTEQPLRGRDDPVKIWTYGNS